MFKIGLPLCAAKREMAKDGLRGRRSHCSSWFGEEGVIDEGDSRRNLLISIAVRGYTGMRCTMRRYRATRFGLWLLVKDIHGIGIDEREFDQLFKTEVIKKTSLVNGNGVGSGGAGKNSKGSVVNVIYA